MCLLEAQERVRKRWRDINIYLCCLTPVLCCLSPDFSIWRYMPRLGHLLGQHVPGPIDDVVTHLKSDLKDNDDPDLNRAAASRYKKDDDEDDERSKSDNGSSLSSSIDSNNVEIVEDVMEELNDAAPDVDGHVDVSNDDENVET